MIIFGTKGRSIKMDSGEFHCPNCNTQRTYNKKYVQDWFTLYFIPTFPVGSKKNDKKYIIYSVKGLIKLSINDCLDKKKIIVSEIENQINNSKRRDYKGNYGDSFGDSLAHISDFDFKDGSTIRVWCSEWDHSNEKVKNYLYENSLSVNLSSKEQVDFVQNEGYNK